MKYLFLTRASIVFALFVTVLLLSCDTGGLNRNTATSDSASNSITKQDTTMPPEPAKAKVAASDSVTSSAQQATSDLIGSKISIHHSKVKVVDTTKRDR